MITKIKGYWIINGSAVSLTIGQVVSYPDNATVEQFDTKELMLKEHELRYPEKYLDDEQNVEQSTLNVL